MGPQAGWRERTDAESLCTRARAHRGFVFDSGGIRVKATNQYVPAQQEKDCFRVLGLDWIECVLRALSALALLRTGLTLYRAHAGRICGMRTRERCRGSVGAAHDSRELSLAPLQPAPSPRPPASSL